MPYLGLWVIVMASGGGADRLQSHGVLSTTATRKVMQLIGQFNPLKPNCSNCHTMPCKPNLPFSISDVRALWCSALSARVPEYQILKMVHWALKC